MIDWSLYPNFTRDELKCKETGECEMHLRVLHVLQEMRDQLKKPLFISSGYRSVKHSVETMKDKPGEHTLGMAVDIICHSSQALEIIKIAQAYRIKRIGVHQKGRASGRFIHIGVADMFTNEFSEGIWTY